MNLWSLSHSGNYRDIEAEEALAVRFIHQKRYPQRGYEKADYPLIDDDGNGRTDDAFAVFEKKPVDPADKSIGECNRRVPCAHGVNNTAQDIS